MTDPSKAPRCMALSKRHKDQTQVALPLLNGASLETIQGSLKLTSQMIDEVWQLAEALESELTDARLSLSESPNMEAVARWMTSHGYATGHGDTLDGLLQHLVREAAERSHAVGTIYVEAVDGMYVIRQRGTDEYWQGPRSDRFAAYPATPYTMGSRDIAEESLATLLKTPLLKPASPETARAALLKIRELAHEGYMYDMPKIERLAQKALESLHSQVPKQEGKS